MAASVSIWSGFRLFQGRGTSSSPASCSTMNRSSGLSRLKRADHVVAILVGVGPRSVVVAVAVGIRITGNIEPVPRPTFAVVWRIEQSVDHPLVSLGGGVREKAIDLLARRWQPGEIEGCAAQEREPVRLGRERRPTFAEVRQ